MTKIHKPNCSFPSGVAPRSEDQRSLYIEPTRQGQLPVTIELTSVHEGLYRNACFAQKNPELWSATVAEAKDACRSVYQSYFPEYQMASWDKYDYNACIFYGRDRQRQVNAMIRVCFNLDGALPVEPFLDSDIDALLGQGRRVAVVGRHFSRGSHFKDNIRAIYQAAKYFHVDTYLIEARSEHKSYYERWFDAREMDSRFASAGCVNLQWDIATTPPLFFRVFGHNQTYLQRFMTECVGGR